GAGPAAATSGTGAATAAQQSPAATPDPVIDQVTKHLLATRLLHDGTRRAVLHLTPDHLGSVRVTVDVRAGQVRVDLAAGEAALHSLRQELGELRSQLAQSGLHLADVTLRDAGTDPGNGRGAQAWVTDPGTGGASGGPSGGPGSSGGRSGDGRPGAPSGPVGAVPAAAPSGPHRAARPHLGRLDVRV
ncbi:MAG TPA: flagellar hook-length control protein FliK, partial [Kineosporiaceae bacterium]|nr:flagellar hook-length control protein FliK [Kineosporiaceae bacterium]